MSLLTVASHAADASTDPKDMKMVAEIRAPEAPREPRIWFTPEYVHYWQNSTPKLPELLSHTVTDTAPAGNFYGNQGITWSNGNGVKLSVGAWIDDAECFGVELNGMYIPRQDQCASFNPLPGNVDAFFSDYNNGAPPHFNENLFPTDPASQAYFHYTTEQYGGEANGLIHIAQWHPVQGLAIWENGLLGFRYFGLKDSYSDSYVEPTGPNPFIYSDAFKTNNNFYGANLGVHVRVEYQRFFAEITPKIALGVTDESVGVNGASSVPSFANPGPGGFYASGNKLGHRSSTPFAYLPQITIKLGYDFNETVEAFAGYDALYLSDVARVENQISTQLDGNQMSGYNFTSSSPADQSPAPAVQSNSLFEQGVTAGIALKF